MKSIVFNGNCQLKSLSETYPFTSFATAFLLSFKVGEQEGPALDKIKADLLRFISEPELKALVRYGGIGISIPTRQIIQTNPDALVLNLFHKRALYTHREQEYTIACKIGDLRRGYPELARYIADNFTIEHQTNARYFEELYDYISMLRSRLPSTRLVLLKRLLPSLYPGLSRQWIHDWTDIADGADDFYRRCERDLNVCIVDTNAIFVDLLESGRHIDEFFPFQSPKISLEKDCVRIEIERDLEHGAVAFWQACGQAVIQQLGLEMGEPFEIVESSSTFELIRLAYNALIESVQLGDPKPVSAFFRKAIQDSDCIDLTNFLVTVALLFDSPEIDELIDSMRGDSRFSLETVFAFQDLQRGRIDLWGRPVYLWCDGPLGAQVMASLPKEIKARTVIVLDNDCGNQWAESITIRPDRLDDEDLGGAVLIVPSVLMQKVEGLIGKKKLANVTLLPSESVFFLEMKKLGAICFNA